MNGAPCYLGWWCAKHAAPAGDPAIQPVRKALSDVIEALWDGTMPDDQHETLVEDGDGQIWTITWY